MTAFCTVAVARATCQRLSLSFPRVWCPELSMLDAEVGEERWLWHVPARAANNQGSAGCAISFGTEHGFAEIPAGFSAPPVALGPVGPNSPISPPVQLGISRIPAGSRRGRARAPKRRKATLTVWLREQGSVLP